MEIIAEISGNHGGDLKRAQKLIAAAAKAGCSHVKFQLYKPDDMPDADVGNNRQMYEKLQVRKEWLPLLFEAAEDADVELFASVFAPWAVHALAPFEPPIFKVASPESTRLTEQTYREIQAAIDNVAGQYVEETDDFDKDYFPEIYVSSGRKDWGWWEKYFTSDQILFCKAGYPAELTDDDLKFLRKHSGEPEFIGFSDHTAGINTTLAAIKLGVECIEKHFKLDDDCVDAAFSLNPSQMKLLCEIAHR